MQLKEENSFARGMCGRLVIQTLPLTNMKAINLNYPWQKFGITCQGGGGDGKLKTVNFKPFSEQFIHYAARE